MLPKLIQELQELEAAYNSLVNPDSAISGKVTELVKAMAQDVTAIKASLHDMADRLEAVELQVKHPAMLLDRATGEIKQLETIPAKEQP